jgi:hypothetical protein
MRLHLTWLLPIASTLTASAQTVLSPWSDSDSINFREVYRMDDAYVNDHAIVHAGGVWHLFYTTGSIARRPWFADGNEVTIGHATSVDLLAWTTHDAAIRIDPVREGSHAHVYAPAVVASGGVYTMFFTENTRGYGAGEWIVSATSSDLEHWTRGSARTVMRPDTTWCEYVDAAGERMPVSCRDPYVIELAEGGWVLYYVARVRVDSAVDGGVARACVAAATSSDMVHWRDRGPVLTRAVSGYDANRWAHPESPCVVRKDGRYYLFWKGGNGTRYVISDDPLDFEGAEEHLLATSHASRIFESDGSWLITSCSRAIGDVLHATSDRTRGLFLGRLDWEGMLPSIDRGLRTVSRQ